MSVVCRGYFAELLTDRSFSPPVSISSASVSVGFSLALLTKLRNCLILFRSRLSPRMPTKWIYADVKKLAGTLGTSPYVPGPLQNCYATDGCR